MDAIASKLGVTQTVAPKRDCCDPFFTGGVSALQCREDPGMSDSQSSLYQATPATPPLVTREALHTPQRRLQSVILFLRRGEAPLFMNLQHSEISCTLTSRIESLFHEVKFGFSTFAMPEAPQFKKSTAEIQRFCTCKSIAAGSVLREMLACPSKCADPTPAFENIFTTFASAYKEHNFGTTVGVMDEMLYSSSTNPRK
eukprot:2283180-Amphidinium_carterae.1